MTSLTTLAISNYVLGPLIVVFLIISLAMILVVLIQKPQGGGLSGAFGSASEGGAGQTAFGARTGDALTTVTVTIFVVFLLTAIGLNFLIQPPTAPAQPTTAQSPAGGAGGDPAAEEAAEEQESGPGPEPGSIGADPSLMGTGRTGTLTGEIEVLPDEGEPGEQDAPNEQTPSDNDGAEDLEG